MNNFTIKKYTEACKHEWDIFLKNSKNYHFFFHRDYIEYHSDRFQDYSLLIYENGKLVAILPANKKGDCLESHGGLTFGGLIYGANIGTAKVLVIFNEILIFLKLNNFKRFVYKVIPFIYHIYPAQEDLYSLFRIKANLYRRDISAAIDNRNKIIYSERRRRGIIKANKVNIIIKEEVNLEEFYIILSNVLKLKYNVKPAHNLNEFQLLNSRFPNNIRLFGATKDKELVSGVLIYETNTVAHCQYIVNSESGKSIGALDLLFDYLIKYYSKTKRYFDFGISNENNGMLLNEGLIKQKEEFGASGIAHDFYEILL